MVCSTDAIRAEILKQLDTQASVAPRDIAQSLVKGKEDWRKLLPSIRREATGLHAEGLLNFIRKKKIVSPEGLKGVFRLAKP